MASTVPRPTFGPTGFVIPDPTDILSACVNDTVTAFGGGLNPSLATPQGQLASSWAAVINNVNETFQFYTQQVDPAYADGRMQDAIARIYFLERKPPLPTVVEALCVGGTGTVIPVGSLAQAADGNLYTCTQAGTIGVSGSVTLTFECNTPGAIGCPAGSLNTIYQTINGWDSVTNPTDGVIGQDVESRRDFEERRFDSVANNALGFLPAVLGAVWKIDGVIDAYVTENFTDNPIVVGGVTIAAHSLYVAVTGGAAADVAKAIWSKKAPGCAMTGNTTVTVFDDVSGYDPPLPSYQIKFTVPDQLPVVFSVNLVSSDQVPSDAVDQIQNVIISAFAGGDGGLRARIGSAIYASRFYGPVSNLGAWAQIISIQLGSLNTPHAQATGSFGQTGTLGQSQMTVTALAAGTIGVGDLVFGTIGGTDVIIGTQILSQLSGSAGGTGVYLVTVGGTGPLTLSSRGILTVVPNQNSVQCQIDQQPITQANIIEVTLT